VEGTDEVGNDAVSFEGPHNDSLHISQTSENNEGGLNKPFISVIMPVYKLSKQVRHSVKAAEKVLGINNCHYEIVVNGGSSDDAYRHASTASRNPAVRSVSGYNDYGLRLGVLNDGQHSGSCC